MRTGLMECHNNRNAQFGPIAMETHTNEGNQTHHQCSPMAVILRRGSETVPAAANMGLRNRTAEEIVDWMIYADRDKAAIPVGFGGAARVIRSKAKNSIENQAHWNKAEPRYRVAIIDKAAGWDAWLGKLAWLDGLSFEDKLREGPPLLGDFDEWLDQVQEITPAWKRPRRRADLMTTPITHSKAALALQVSQTAQFIADVPVPLNFDLAATFEQRFVAAGWRRHYLPCQMRFRAQGQLKSFYYSF